KKRKKKRKTYPPARPPAPLRSRAAAPAPHASPGRCLPPPPLVRARRPNSARRAALPIPLARYLPPEPSSSGPHRRRRLLPPRRPVPHPYRLRRTAADSGSRSNRRRRSSHLLALGGHPPSPSLRAGRPAPRPCARRRRFHWRGDQEAPRPTRPRGARRGRPCHRFSSSPHRPHLRHLHGPPSSTPPPCPPHARRFRAAPSISGDVVPQAIGYPFSC
ncbi:Os04g0164300, partial [Oryza sativa Japonica Group]